MILVDTALQARAEQNRPIRVGMIGAGFMGQGLTNQIVNSVPTPTQDTFASVFNLSFNYESAADYGTTANDTLGAAAYDPLFNTIDLSLSPARDQDTRRLMAIARLHALPPE